MDRKDALLKITELKMQDLRALASKYQVTVEKGGKINKGWAGHVIERHLGLAINSAQSPNFGSWELKVIPVRYRKDGLLSLKETMAITMIDPYEVTRKDFEDSHLLNKLRKILIVSRIFESKLETCSLVHNVVEFDLSEPAIYEQVKLDYDLIRNTIQEKGFSALSGKMGTLIQPRTKGPGHGSTSRAFYARKAFIEMMLNIKK